VVELFAVLVVVALGPVEGASARHERALFGSLELEISPRALAGALSFEKLNLDEELGTLAALG
jgi:hypothetical protein